MSHPSQNELAQALADAATAHHDYEQVSLSGERDDQWSGFYAAFVLGRLGEVASPSTLSRWLEEALAGDQWAQSAAAHVSERLSR